MKLHIKEAFRVLLGGHVEKVTVRVVILDQEAYKKLEKSVRGPLPNPGYTQGETAFLLGVQHVLKVIRDGI